MWAGPVISSERCVMCLGSHKHLARLSFGGNIGHYVRAAHARKIFLMMRKESTVS